MPMVDGVPVWAQMFGRLVDWPSGLPMPKGHIGTIAELEAEFDRIIETPPVAFGEVTPARLIIAAFWAPGLAERIVPWLRQHADDCHEPRRSKILALVEQVEEAAGLGEFKDGHVVWQSILDRLGTDPAHAKAFRDYIADIWAAVRESAEDR
jgi:hypothetical protein